jgi:hypothetical protein
MSDSAFDAFINNVYGRGSPISFFDKSGGLEILNDINDISVQSIFGSGPYDDESDMKSDSKPYVDEPFVSGSSDSSIEGALDFSIQGASDFSIEGGDCGCGKSDHVEGALDFSIQGASDYDVASDVATCGGDDSMFGAIDVQVDKKNNSDDIFGSLDLSLPPLIDVTPILNVPMKILGASDVASMISEYRSNN